MANATADSDPFMDSYLNNMSSPEPPQRRQPAPKAPPAARDDLDDLFGFDEDPFATPPKAPEPKKTAKNARKSDALGIDEEVEVTRKARAPRAKLDETRLLSENGIPKLRRRAKDHLKFKGKGHEFSDTARLLSFYQLWLDDLFPKARFLDALSMVEKLGHKKRIQMMRMEWINEGKPRASEPEDEEPQSIFDEPALPAREPTAARIAPIFERRQSERPKTPADDVPDDEEDLYGATPLANRTRPAGNQAAGAVGEAGLFGPANETANDEPPEDDLDALFAEGELDEPVAGSSVQPKPAPRHEDNFDDDEEAMMEMDGMW